MDGEEIFALFQVVLKRAGAQIPVVPLTPGDGVGGVSGSSELERPGCVFAVDVDGNRSAAVRGVKKISRVGAAARDVDGDVEPLAGLGPANVEEIGGWGELVEGIVIDGCGWVVEFGV